MLFDKQKIGGLIISLSLLVIAGCGGGPTQAPDPVTPAPFTPTPTPEPKDGSQTFSGETWELTVPSTVEERRGRTMDMLFVGVDNTEKRLIVLIGKEVKGNSTVGLAQLTTEAKSGLSEDGWITISENRGTINGVPFVYLQNFKPPVVMHNWILVNSEQGYVLACGGLMTNAASHGVVCTNIARSLKLK